MATIKRFEEILAWQEARKLAKLVYQYTQDGRLAKDFGMRDQIQRAAVSVGSNIAEGFARSGNKEFANFLWIAKGSAAEVQSQAYTILDAGYITRKQFEALYKLAARCSYLIYQFIDSLHDSPVKGRRYHTPSPAS